MGRLTATGTAETYLRFLHYGKQVMTLLPGDVILTGPPGGIGPLHAGDEVEVRIEGVGVLRNRVKDR